VVSYCSRSNHETTKLHNPAVSYATVDGRSGGVRDSYGYDTLLVHDPRGVFLQMVDRRLRSKASLKRTLCLGRPRSYSPLRRSGGGLRRRILKDSAGRMSRRPSLRKFN
jgi:hypothetical protein